MIKLIDTKLIAEVILEDKHMINMTIDTGSPISILRREHVTELTGCDMDYLGKVFKKSEYFVEDTWYSKNNSIIVPCYLTGATIGELQLIDKFYFGLSLAKSGDPVIGLDFLSSSKFKYDGSNINFIGFDFRKYILYFRKFFNGMDIDKVYEIKK